MSVFKELALKILPRVRVHSWGGFGSQLFAMIIAERLIAKAEVRTALQQWQLAQMDSEKNG